MSREPNRMPLPGPADLNGAVCLNCRRLARMLQDENAANLGWRKILEVLVRRHGGMETVTSKQIDKHVEAGFQAVISEPTAGGVTIRVLTPKEVKSASDEVEPQSSGDDAAP